MTPEIPSEQDFLATPDLQDEALQNNRINGLPAKRPTEIRRKAPEWTKANPVVLEWTSTTPEGAKAWVDDMILELQRMDFAEQVASWELEFDRDLTILHKYFAVQYDRILDAIWDAKENARTLRS